MFDWEMFSKGINMKIDSVESRAHLEDAEFQVAFFKSAAVFSKAFSR